MNDLDSVPKLTNKNYTLWRLSIQDQLEKRKIFAILTDDRIANRSYSSQWNTHSRQMVRNKKQDALEFLLSTLSTEIYEEVKLFDQPIKVWEYLENKYSMNSIKKLSNAMKELQSIRFTSVDFDIFLECKFKRILNKISDCGLQLEDNHLNLYLLSSLDKSKRLEDAKYFYDKLNCSFNEFKSNLKDKIIENPNFKNDFEDHYSDISNESFKDYDSMQIDSNLKSLDVLSNKIDKNLKQLGVISESDLNKSTCSTSKDVSTNQSKEDDPNISRRIDQAFPFLSPIRNIYEFDKKDSNQFEIDDECNQTIKVFEDLTPIDQNFSSFESAAKSPAKKNISTFERERSPFFTSSQNEVEKTKSISLKDNFQLEDDQQTGDNINLSDINLRPETDPNYFFIDKNGSC